MKLARVVFKKKEYWVKIEKDSLRVLKDVPFKRIVLSKKRISLKEVKFLTPTTPSKIILVGLNYKDHAKELGMKVPENPIIFLKPPTAALAHKSAIIYPRDVKRLDYEAELAIVIGKRAKSVSARLAHKHILGYTCFNDVTARDIQKRDGQWTRAKSFDSFAPFGPWIETHLDPTNLIITLCLNNKVMQKSSTKNFIFSPFHLVSFISRVMRLDPGDIISTGTPPGVGRMKRGDEVKVEISKIGVLSNFVA